MKHLPILPVILLSMLLASCQDMTNVEQEKEAIMDVILQESETARAGDLDGTMSTYLDDEHTLRLYYSMRGYEVSKGMEEIREFLGFVEENADRDLSQIEVSKENPLVRVRGNSAWALCDNIWEGSWEEGDVRMDNLQITFLEKVEGSWKISFVTWLPKPGKDAEMIRNSSMVSQWEISLNKGVDVAEVEEYILKDFIPAFEESYAGIRLFLLKSDRGMDDGSLCILLVFDSIEERNAWWPRSGEPSEKASEASEKMNDVSEQLMSMIQMNSWNDYLIMK